MAEYVVAIFKPHMRMKGIIDHDIVFNNTIYTFTKFYSPIQTKVVVNNIVTGAVIKIYIPTMIATKAVITNSDGFHHIKHGKIVIGFYNGVECSFVRMPIAVTSPGIKWTMITTFFYCIEDIIVFNDMPAPGSLTYIDAGTGHIINSIMTYRYTLAHG